MCVGFYIFLCFSSSLSAAADVPPTVQTFSGRGVSILRQRFLHSQTKVLPLSDKGYSILRQRFLHSQTKVTLFWDKGFSILRKRLLHSQTDSSPFSDRGFSTHILCGHQLRIKLLIFLRDEHPQIEVSPRAKHILVPWTCMCVQLKLLDTRELTSWTHFVSFHPA